MFKSSLKLSKSAEVHYAHPEAAVELSDAIRSMVERPFITICIGTDRCIGDCLGPLVGSALVKSRFPYPVYGTLEHPIHAMNLVERLAGIQFHHPNLPILAVDASLGKYQSVGKLQVKKGPISPGKGVGKVLPDVGDYSFIGIVDTYNDFEELTIHQVRLHLIHEMAKVVAKSLFLSIGRK